MKTTTYLKAKKNEFFEIFVLLFFENIILLHNLRAKNFVIITPRFIAILFKKIIIFNKKK